MDNPALCNGPATTAIVQRALMIGIMAFFLSGLAACADTAGYSAWVQYQIVAPQRHDQQGQPSDTHLSLQEIQSYVSQQSDLLDDNDFLDAVLSTDAFRYDYRDGNKPPSARRASRFLLAYAVAPKDALKKAIAVYITDTDFYRLTFTGIGRHEVTAEINALAQIYENTLVNLAGDDGKRKLENLRTTRKELQQQVEDAGNDVENYRGREPIFLDDSRPRQTLEIMAKAVAQAEAETNQAKNNYLTMKSQIAAGTFKPTPEQQVFINNDPEIAGLINEKQALERERQTLIADRGMSDPKAKAIDVRIAACQKQIDLDRNDVAEELCRRSLASAQARETDLKSRQNDLVLQIKDLDQTIEQYKSLKDKLDQAQKRATDVDQKILLIEYLQDVRSPRLRRVGQPVCIPKPYLW